MKTVYMMNGLMRSGKDFTTNLLRQHLEDKGKSVEIIAFAEPMKQIVSTMFGITLDQLEEYKNNLERYHLVPIDMKDGNHGEHTNFRSILQLFGSEAMKTIFGTNVWSELAYNKVETSKADVIIISDFRFTEEYNYFVLNNALSKYDIQTVHIIGESDKSANTHDSEVIPNIKFSHILDNSKRDDTVLNWVTKETA